jgi:hypothetical protein
MTAQTFGTELTALRRRLDALHREAPSPAVAAYLRLMAEAAFVAQGYVDPEAAGILPGEYETLSPGGTP